MDKMREEFEVWCCERGFTLKPAETNCGVLIDGEYGHPRVQLAWESWKASRSALCVELPDSKDDYHSSSYFEDGWLKGFNNCLSDALDALDQAGVSYK